MLSWQLLGKAGHEETVIKEIVIELILSKKAIQEYNDLNIRFSKRNCFEMIFVGNFSQFLALRALSKDFFHPDKP